MKISTDQVIRMVFLGRTYRSARGFFPWWTPYSALTSWRPYRDRWDNRAALAEMGRDARKGKFDPDVLESLGKLIGVTK